MDTGFCYAVLFSNGVSKFGMTSDLAGRIKCHCDAAGHHGVSATKILFSMANADYQKQETEILEMAISIGKKSTGNEYFSEISIDNARHIMKTVCGYFFECDELKRGNEPGTVLAKIRPYGLAGRNTRGKPASSVALSQKIIQLITGSPSTIAVIFNRTKKPKIEIITALCDLELSGLVQKITVPHNGNKKPIEKWVAI